MEESKEPVKKSHENYRNNRDPRKHSNNAQSDAEMKDQSQQQEQRSQQQNYQRPQKAPVAQIKNKQDQQTRIFGTSIDKFLKNGRGWFPPNLPKHLADKCKEGKNRSSNLLRVMSYNILAPSLVGEVDYGQMDKSFLEWENRIKQIKIEIEYMNPHIVCLQEVEQNSGIIEFLTDEMNFSGGFLQKAGNSRVDGVATYFCNEKFVMIDKYEVRFSFNARSNIYNKPACALIIALQPVDFPEKVYLIGNTHLNFNSNRGDIKLAQLKMLTDAVAQLKSYYQDVCKKQAIVIISGDFNSTPKSGIYEYMRTGMYDCLKLDRAMISGQQYATYSVDEHVSSITFSKSTLNLDAETLLKGYSEMRYVSEWYVEIQNTYPHLEFNKDGKPTHFSYKTSLPFDKVRMAESRKEPSADEQNNYMKLVSTQLDSFQQQSVQKFFKSPQRPFFWVKNECGPFKSAYAQCFLNQVLAINFMLTEQPFPVEQLDIYTREKEDFIVSEMAVADDKLLDLYVNHTYNDPHNEVYGAVRMLKKGVNVNEWLKLQSTVSKEPSYTAFTNIKGTVDYIFYQGECINVIRVLDIPGFTRFMRNNITCLPHPLMPSDHISIVADFYIFPGHQQTQQDEQSNIKA